MRMRTNGDTEADPWRPHGPQLPFNPFQNADFSNVGNLKNFVTDIKSKLRDEFSALIALADAEEAMLEGNDVLPNHPSMMYGRKRRFWSPRK